MPIRWTAFPLHPETPLDGQLLSDLFAAHPGYLETMWPRLQRAATELGLDLAERTHTYNSRRACELARWAEKEGRGWAFHRAIYEAFFARGENIAQPEVLERAAEQAGLDAGRIPHLLKERPLADAIDADWQRCAARGITAIPTVEAAGKRLVGFGPLQELQELLAGFSRGNQ